MPDLGPAGDDKHCPECGSGDYWLYETEKECKACGATWLSAWSLVHNDDPAPGGPGTGAPQPPDRD